MLNAIRRALLRCGVSPASPTPRTANPAAWIDRLEDGRLMAGDVPLVAQAFFGPAEQVTSVVLTFDVPLDPATAANTAAYRIVTVTKERNDGVFGDGSTDRD